MPTRLKIFNDHVNAFLRGSYCFFGGWLAFGALSLLFINATTPEIVALCICLFFPFLMVILVYKAIYPTLPKKVWRMLYLLLSPFAWLLIQALASPLSLQIYVMQLGLIDFIAMFALLPENYLDAPIDWRSPGQIFSNIKSYPGFYLTWYFIILLGGVGLGVALRILFVQIVALQAQINWLNYQLVFVAAIFASSVVHAYYALKPVVKASPDCISIVNQYRKMKTDHAAKK